MSKSQFPKILIVGQAFTLNKGGGITMANLFKGWPHDKIAVATQNIDRSGFEYCITYYRIGFDETKRPWPFYLFQPKYRSEPVVIKKPTVQKKQYSVKKSKYHPGIKRTFNLLLHFLGIYYFIFKLKVSSKFLDWIDEYKPDMIYAQLSKLEDIKFVNELLDLRKLPLAIHIMDDWPKTLNKKGILSFYWGAVINKGFRKLLDRASVLMSICKAMSDEYKLRYNKKFIPFLNTIEWEKYEPFTKKNHKYKDCFKVLYAGRIGVGTSESVHSIIKAIGLLVNKGLDIEFLIQTNEKKCVDKIKRKGYDHMKFPPFLDYHNLPEKFSSVDLLVLPMDFKKRNLKFIHLSMPTKVPEYMASGTPILVFAHKTTALYKYAKETEWAYTVSDNNINSIAEAIERIYKDELLRKTLNKKAINIVKTNHDANIIRKKFKETLLIGIENIN